MVYRAKNPVTITCDQCGETKDLKGQITSGRKDGNFCSRRCSAAWHREEDAITVWRLMELTRLLWECRPKKFKFKPREYPGLPIWRRELKATSKWLREIA